MKPVMKKKKRKPVPRQRTILRWIIGWREHIELPDMGIGILEAKIDSGARTSAIHAVDIEPIDRGGVPHVSFSVPLTGHGKTYRCIEPVIDLRKVKNTSGIPEQRFIIRTDLVLGPRRWPIEVSLADRGLMGFDLILGRTAIRRHRILVDPERSFLAAGGPRKMILGT